MKLQDVIQSKHNVEERLAKVETEMKDLKNKQTTLWKAMANINKKLLNMCNHEWTRETYQYSPLYCKVCGVER